MIFQDPFACLHPMYRVGDQIAEAVHAHADVSSTRRTGRAPSSCSAQVGIPNAQARARDYPHQFSGGMRQRAMIAMALVHNPRRADRRRADDGARRDRAGADPRADRPREEGVRHRRDPDHARPRRRRRDRDSRAWSCTPAARWSTARRTRSSTRPSIRTPGACSSRCRRVEQAARRASSPIEGSPPSLLTPPPGCPFHPRCKYRFEPCDTSGRRSRRSPAGTSTPATCPPSASARCGRARRRRARRASMTQRATASTLRAEHDGDDRSSRSST